ncbi:Csm2p [Lachancea thermotolerans CBS 6340]|uniref:KLTH0G09064p n=1 Tax=Lachancea thermotolerans (strain ATCC 56472 / CBS 6340 / NRRL Y-8284) TaxID=559295 RepID=C5DMH8_LACTC|nr:KLTH0G09064p [Lachancea thermotolerans CBS 6340]CAR24989.1 KLTH0G09064p [Lachancea thermotolerans CBS 6340]
MEPAPALLPNDKVVLWFDSDEECISKMMATFLTVDSAEQSAKTLYFIDAMDRFPIKEFCRLVPPKENAAVYENVRIMASLDMEELSSVVSQVVSSAQMSHSTRLRDPSAPQPQVCVVIRGLDVIFRNTALKDQARAHLLLKDIMLRVRMMANTDPLLLKAVLLFEVQQKPRGINLPGSNDSSQNAPPPSKRPRSDYRSGAPNNLNSIAVYLMKFYADRVI